MLRRAIERELEILGEAANRVSKDFQTAHDGIDWGQIIGLRNGIIHRYDQIEDERMWNIVSVQVPQLLAQAKPLVPPLPECKRIAIAALTSFSEGEIFAAIFAAIMNRERQAAMTKKKP